MTTTIGSLDLGTLNDLYSDSTQYFWFESDSSSAWGSGAHVTLYPESQFTDSTNTNYMKGQNIIMNTDGFSIRNGALPMMVLDNNSLDFNAVDTSTGTYITMATFGASGAIIGEIANNKTRAEITSNGMELIKRNNLGTDKIISHNGYGTVNTTVEGGDTEDGTYFTLFFTPNYIPGRNSVSIGSSIANAKYSFAMGDNCVAAGECSFAMGEDCMANGSNSVCLNFYTTANGDYQTVIGRYNKPDTTSAFIIGNGLSPNASDLSNIFIVDWSGNVDISGQYKISGAQIGSVMRLHGSSFSSPLATSYKTISLATTADIDTGNVFTAASNGIKCAYSGTVHLVGKVRFNDSFTANDYMVAQIYNTTQAASIQIGRMRTPTQVFNGDVWVDAYARVNANDVLLLRAENASGGRGTVTVAECSLTACYISV